MLVPQKNSNFISIVHLQKDSSFIGVCKNIHNEEIQTIEVFLNNNKIDSFEANEIIDRIEEIYDIKGFSFKYNLPDKYVENEIFISFKIQETKQELQNSPLFTSDKFYEYKFISTLDEDINEIELKNIYKKGCIGFFGIEENLEDENFTQYIITLAKRNPQIKIKIFYFNKYQEKLANKYFKNINVTLIRPKNSSSILKEIEIFFITTSNINIDLLKFQRVFPQYTNEVLLTLFNKDYEKTTIKEHNNKDYINSHPFFLYPEEYNFTKEEIKESGNNIYKLLFEHLFNSCNINKQISLDQNLYKFEHFDKVLLVLENKIFKTKLIDIHKRILKHRG